MFKCICCGMKKEDSYCCENDVVICLDCCDDNCEDSQEERKKEVSDHIAGCGYTNEG